MRNIVCFQLPPAEALELVGRIIGNEEGDIEAEDVAVAVEIVSKLISIAAQDPEVCIIITHVAKSIHS